MKQHFHYLRQSLAALVVLAAGLSSCNRAEYAMLPKSSPYHGTERVVAVKPAPAAEAVAPVAEEVAAPAVVAAAPVVVAQPAPVAKATRTTKAPAKLNFVQKAVVKKALKGADKVAAKMQIKKHRDAASADDSNALAKNIKMGIILLLIGALLSIFGGVIGLLGGIIAIIGIILIVLGLLDEV